MISTTKRSETRGEGQPRWSLMIILSLALHLVVFSLIFFVPNSFPSRRINGTFYEVDLVELPRERRLGGTEIKENSKPAGVPVPAKEDKTTQLIKRPKSEKKPIPIAKRTVKAKEKKESELQESPSRLLDKAMSKIENEIEVKKVEENQKEKGSANHNSQEVAKEAQTPGTSGRTQGISMEIYKRQVESRIAENWSYPVALADWNATKSLEAVIILNVKSDGKIINFRFERHSANNHFDQSVLKAVEKTESLPRFPLGYHESKEELVITFNLKKLLGS